MSYTNPVLRCISNVFRQLIIVLPYMPLYRFYTAFGIGAQLSDRTVGAYFLITLVFPVSVTVCYTVF